MGQRSHTQSPGPALLHSHLTVNSSAMRWRGLGGIWVSSPPIQVTVAYDSATQTANAAHVWGLPGSKPKAFRSFPGPLCWHLAVVWQFRLHGLFPAVGRGLVTVGSWSAQSSTSPLSASSCPERLSTQSQPGPPISAQGSRTPTGSRLVESRWHSCPLPLAMPGTAAAVLLDLCVSFPKLP